jgi:hypothetical protein
MCWLLWSELRDHLRIRRCFCKLEMGEGISERGGVKSRAGAIRVVIINAASIAAGVHCRVVEHAGMDEGLSG